MLNVRSSDVTLSSTLFNPSRSLLRRGTAGRGDTIPVLTHCNGGRLLVCGLVKKQSQAKQVKIKQQQKGI